MRARRLHSVPHANKTEVFLLQSKTKIKKEAITFFLRGRNEWETGMSKQLAHSEILLALFSDNTYLHSNLRSGSIFVSLCK